MNRAPTQAWTPASAGVTFSDIASRGEYALVYRDTSFFGE